MAERLELPDEIGRSTYHALLFAVQDYMHDDEVKDLVHPVRDALRLSDVLTSHFLFESENLRIVENPTRSEVFGALDEQAKNVREGDHLLIFFAGHGYWDESLKQGYWLPSDCREGNRSSWISNATIRDWVRGISSKHTLLISDACFSGGIFKTRKAFSKQKVLRRLYELPSRKAMTSGTLTEVPDESVFLRYLTNRLKKNKDPWISAERLFNAIEEPVINNCPIESMPQYGTIHDTGDEGGDFIFLRKGALEAEEARRSKEKEKESKNEGASRAQVSRFASSEFQAATLVVVSNCTGTVLIDGEEEQAIKAKKPLKLNMQAGSHVIQINADGYISWTKKIMVRAGESEVLEAELEQVVKELAVEDVPVVHEKKVVSEPLFTDLTLIGDIKDVAYPFMSTWWKRALLGVGVSAAITLVLYMLYSSILNEPGSLSIEFWGIVVLVTVWLPIILAAMITLAKRFGLTLKSALVGGFLFGISPFIDVGIGIALLSVGWGVFLGAVIGRFALPVVIRLVRPQEEVHHV